MLFRGASLLTGNAETGGGSMTRSAAFVVALVFIAGIQPAGASPQQPGSAPSDAKAAPILLLPAGTRIELSVTAPVWAAQAKVGDPLYMQTSFPVLAGGGIAIPAGTWVQGRIESVERPSRRQKHAEIEVLFTKMVFADGYVIALPDVDAARIAYLNPVPNSSSNSDAIASAPIATAAKLTVNASPANDLLLDNGAEIEMTLAAPLALDRSEIALAVPLSRAPQPGAAKSATLCRPTPGTPGTPGTPDTVIPGSPGTPSTTIPGGPGMPDTVLPGTPATPDTVIPGSPGSPGFAGTVCPAAPLVISSVPITIAPRANSMAATQTRQ